MQHVLMVLLPDGGFTLANWSFAGPGTLTRSRGACRDRCLLQYLESIIGRIGAYSTQMPVHRLLWCEWNTNNRLDYFENNGPSIEQQFTVSGSNLTSAVNVTSYHF